MCMLIGNGIQSKQSMSVINVLRTLVLSKSAEVFVPFDYSKESASVTDSDVHFIEGSTAKVVDMVSHQERFNFSIKAVVPVKVEIDGVIKDKKVFRNYSVVRDGKLNMNSINVKFIDKDMYDVLNSVGLVDDDYDIDRVYTINFSGMPILSYDWAKPNQYGLVDMLKKESDISTALKIVKNKIKDMKPMCENVESTESEFYNEKVEYHSKDKLIRPCVVYDIPDYKSIYSVQFNTYEEAEMLKKELTKKLADVRFGIRCIVLATENSANKGNYEWSELVAVPRSKEKMMQTVLTTDKCGNSFTLRRLVYNKGF